MVKYYSYPRVSQSFLLVLICFIMQVVTGVIAGIVVYARHMSISATYIPALWLSQACVLLTVFYGVRKSGIPLKEYYINRVGNKRVIIYSIIFFIGLYFASSVLAGLMQNIIPSDSAADAALNQALNCPTGIFLTVLVAPVFEETLFRGIILRGFLKNYSIAKSLIITSLLFGLLHFNSIQSITAAILGLALGWVFVKTGSLWVTILLHALNNGMSAVLYHLTLRYNISDSQFLYAAIIAVAAGITAFIFLKKIPDNISHIMGERDEALQGMEELQGIQEYAPGYPCSEPLKHSGFGIASFIISLAAWSADIVSLIMVFVMASMFRSLSTGFAAIALSVFAMSSFAAITGLALGIAGAVNRHRKKAFPVLGIIFNSFVILFLVLLVSIGFYITRTLPAGGVNL